MTNEVPAINIQKIEVKPSLEPKLEKIETIAESANLPSTQPMNVGATGKTEWMQQAGIPESDWYYVDCVINGCEGVSAEGGWNGTEKWNTAGSGAYGLCQSLPATKMASAGADYMTNPVTQLKWCHSYAQGYGGWKAAWDFRKCKGSCYSTRTNSTPYKDHTWW